MNEGNNIERLKGALHDSAKRVVPTQVFWGTVKEVDWDAKTCTVTGLEDELDFFDVSLGISNKFIKPEIGTKCLIGSIGNDETEMYLIEAESFEEYFFIAGSTELHVTKDGFIIKKGNADLKEMIEKLLNQLKAAIIQTPAGPGNFSPNDLLAFEELKITNENLFK